MATTTPRADRGRQARGARRGSSTASRSTTNRRCGSTLLQGMARGEKMDRILQKATELGVAAFMPVLFARSEVRLDGARARQAAGALARRGGLGLRAVRSRTRARGRAAEPLRCVRHCLRDAPAPDRSIRTATHSLPSIAPDPSPADRDRHRPGGRLVAAGPRSCAQPASPACAWGHASCARKPQAWRRSPPCSRASGIGRPPRALRLAPAAGTGRPLTRQAARRASASPMRGLDHRGPAPTRRLRSGGPCASTPSGTGSRVASQRGLASP